MKRRDEKSDATGKREKRSKSSSSKPTEVSSTSNSVQQANGNSEMSATSRKVTSATVKHTSRDKADAELADGIDKFEEHEAEQNDPLEDLSTFKKTCEKFQEAVTDINRLKAKGEEKSEDDIFQIAEQRSEVVLLATHLRRLNRRAQIRGKKAKENTSEVKKKVDACHLDLQNLLYEIMHMKQEITKCTDFTSKDEDIELVSVEDFYAVAPEEVSKPDVTLKDEHQQMLARLDWELKQRQQMASRKEECVALKQEIHVELQKKASCLQAAAPGLDNILKVAGQLLDSVGYLEASKKEAMDYEMAQYLPQPLYGLYVQSKSYKDVWDSSLIVNIEGDVQEAKADATTKQLVIGDDLEEDVDVDEQNEEGEREDKKHRKRDKEKQKFRQEAKRRSILRVHPLHIKLTMQCEEEAEVTLSFFYFTTLKIVTVKVDLKFLKFEPAPVSTNCSLLSPETVFHDLYDNDNGQTTPNQANHSQLSSLGITSISSLGKEVGIPYYWAQWLCWLKYLPTENNQESVASNLMEAQRVENVLKAVKERILVRLSLQRQLVSFEKLEVPRTPHAEVAGPPEDPITRLASWKCITEEEVKGMSLTTQFETSKLLENSHSYYLASFERREGTLACIIVLHTDYPHRPPVFILKVKMKISKTVEINCVRGMEQEINTCCNQELVPSNPSLILTAQLKKLQMLFDIFCETQSEEPSKSRLFLNAKSGRDRRNPLKYVTQGQLKLFVHQQ